MQRHIFMKHGLVCAGELSNDSRQPPIEVHCRLFIHRVDIRNEKGRENTCEQDWERWRFSSVWD